MVYVPRSYTNTMATPVFLNFHGYLSTMEQQFEIAGMDIVWVIRASDTMQ